MDSAVQWQRLMSLLTVTAQEQCPERVHRHWDPTFYSGGSREWCREAVGGSQEVPLEEVMF